MLKVKCVYYLGNQLFIRIIDSCTKHLIQVNCIFLLMKSSKKYLIFLPAFYPIMWLMISPKNFEKNSRFENMSLYICIHNALVKHYLSVFLPYSEYKRLYSNLKASISQLLHPCYRATPSVAFKEMTSRFYPLTGPIIYSCKLFLEYIVMLINIEIYFYLSRRTAR